MKTDTPPPDYEELKALLSKSFHSEEADGVPPLPDDLRDRIRDQYGKAQTPSQAPTQEHSLSIFTKISRLFAQPAFSGAIAALVLLAVAAFLLLPDRPDSGGIRGNDNPPVSVSTATILLYGVSAEQAVAIKSQLDPKSAKIVTDLTGEPSAEGRTIIIDGKAGLIKGYASPDATAQTAPLPQNATSAALAIVKMLETLRGEE